MKVALVHDWLTGMRGGERVLEVFGGMYPDAPIYTLLRRKDWQPEFLKGREVHTSFLQRWPAIESRYRYYLPLFPRAIEQFDLSGFDLVISSSHCVAKGVTVGPNTCHVSYVHAPMRYMWNQFEEYFGNGRASWWVRAAARWMRPHLQQWDVASSARVTAFTTNSQYTADQIQSLYGRPAEILYAPVDVDHLSVSTQDDGFYLMVTALVPYKQVDVAIETFRRLGVPLKIVGEGPDRKRLERMAPANVTFLGWLPDEAVRECYAKCRALIFPGQEDFGIVPVEAMACGKPVIALGKGGVTETVIPWKAGSARMPPTGVWFDAPTPEAMAEAIHLFEAHRKDFEPEAARAHAVKFSTAIFRSRMENAVRHALHQFGRRRAGKPIGPPRA